MYIWTPERLGQVHEPSTVIKASEIQLIEKALQSTRNENVLTNTVFNARHPERRGRHLEHGDPDFDALAKEWREIRENLVRPVLKRTKAAPGHTQAKRRLIYNFKITPSIIRVHENESARISFLVGDRISAVDGMIFKNINREGTAFRYLKWTAPQPGYQVAVWDGTFDGIRNQPLATGKYPVWIMVSDQDGNKDEAWGLIQVLNPQMKTVLPRTFSGLSLSVLRFDGTHAILSDEKGNAIQVRASSGLKPSNPKNVEGINYTRPQYQWKRGRGPIPDGKYFIRKHSAQSPALPKDRKTGKRSLQYPTGGSARIWGPFRVPLHPFQVKNRSGFFLHLDVTNDGTAGCIGVHPKDEGKFNQIMSLIMHMPNDELPVIVEYAK